MKYLNVDQGISMDDERSRYRRIRSIETRTFRVRGEKRKYQKMLTNEFRLTIRFVEIGIERPTDATIFASFDKDRVKIDENINQTWISRMSTLRKRRCW